jgi:hypothetical protein
MGLDQPAYSLLAATVTKHLANETDARIGCNYELVDRHRSTGN